MGVHSCTELVEIKPIRRGRYGDIDIVCHANKSNITMKTIQKFQKTWVKATTLGFFSFLLMIPISFIFTVLFHPLQSEGLTLPQIFNQSMDKSPLEYGWRFFIALQLGHFILYVIVGAILSHLQYMVLKEYIPNKLKWTFLTILGLELILLGDLFYTGLSTGGAPGPLEPLLIGLGGGGLMALMQFLYLRSIGVKSARWLGWWILGIVTGILTSIIFIISYEYFLIESVRQSVSPMAFLVINWLSFILPYFTFIGFFAGLFSAKPLYRALEQSPLNGGKNKAQTHNIG